MSDIAAQPGDVIDFSKALINAMTVASKDMGLERMHDMAKVAGNVKKVMAVVC